MRLNSDDDIASYYHHAGVTASLVDPAGTYSLASASAPTPADAGTYIPVSGATSSAAEIVDPAGGAGASVATIDQAGADSRPGTSAPRLAAAGAYGPVRGAPSAAAETIDPARAYALAGASVPKTDPAGAYSGAGLSLPTPAAATYIPGAGAPSSSSQIVDASGMYSGASPSAATNDPAEPPTPARARAFIAITGTTSASAEIVDPGGTSSAAVASARPANQVATSSDLSVSAPALNPKGAPPGYYYQAGATAYVKDPAGTYSLAGASAPTADPAGTYSGAGASAPTLAKAGTYILDPEASQYGFSRLFLENSNYVPFNEVLSFNSVTAVENFFGVGSFQATLATEFFSGYSGSSAHMLFNRMPLGGGRARIFGANLSGLTLAQLHVINGTLSLTSQGYNFNASVNLASATSFASAASLIQSALNAVQPTVATMTGSSIAPESASFTGSIEGGLMVVTAVSSGQIAIGGTLTSANGYSGQIIYQDSGTPGGVGVYNVWYGAPGNIVSAPPGTALSETYGILTIGTVNSGAVAVGQEVTGSGVAANTAIEANISGSGAGSTWVVELTQTVASEAMKAKAAPLLVTNDAVTGATVDTDSFWIEANGDGYRPTTMTYASGTAAASLGLTQSTGAYLSTPGQITTSPSAWLNNIVANENSDWSSFQMDYPTAPDTASALSAWSAASGGQFQYVSGYTFTTPPIAPSSSAAEIRDPAGTYSRAGASAPTPAAAGTYIPGTGATSAAAEISDPAGTYSGPGASAPTTDPAGTYSGAGASAPTPAAAGTYILDAAASPYGLDRLFLEYNPEIPFNEVLSFNSVTAVENFFGVSSAEATLAADFFSGDSGSSAHMLFDRMPLGGGRARIYGANLSDLALAQLQAINGTLSLTSEGYNFNASVNLANATSFASAASLIQSALNAAQPTEATATGSSIAPASASFAGSIEGGLMDVTAVSSGQIAIGGILTSANGYSGHIICQDSGTPGGVGVYNVWYGAPGNGIIAPPGTALSETYGILTIGTVNSGAVAVGQEVTGSGVAANTAIEANISGSGAGSTWVVDLTQTVASEPVTMMAAPLEVDYHPVAGATVNSDSFWIEADLNYPLPSTTMTYASGTTAASLGLMQSAGAYLSTLGQVTTSPSAWLNNVVANENSDWSSFQMTYPTAPDTANALSAWSAASGGQFQYLSGYAVTTPPIVPSSSAAEIVDPAGTYSGAGASAPTTDPAGTYNGSGASAPTAAQPGYYVATAGASAEISAQPGYYVATTRASTETTDPAGTYSSAGATAPIGDPAGTYSRAGASATTTDPAGSYSLAGASAPTPAQPGYYVPTAGASSENSGRSWLLHAGPGRDGGDQGAAAGHIGHGTGADYCFRAA